MALALTRDLSLIDFVGMEEEMNMPDAEEGIDVFAFVCKYAASRLREVESALKKREETKAELYRIKVRRRLLVRNLDIPNKKMTAKKKATSPKEEEEMPPPHHAGAESTSSMRPQRRRKPAEYFDDEMGSSSSSKRAYVMGVESTSDLLAL